ncbi:hypothetical protein [Novipirellula herctigrandis]|uniref:hypothetical protein n=1 Tax=Novipirellula herctigrandis TaxID=2527986 RepID=UPI003AF408D9
MSPFPVALFRCLVWRLHPPAMKFCEVDLATVQQCGYGDITFFNGWDLANHLTISVAPTYLFSIGPAV